MFITPRSKKIYIFYLFFYRNDVEAHNLPTVALICGLVIMMMWSVLCTIWVYPHNVGISLSIFFELLLMISAFHLIGVSAH